MILAKIISKKENLIPDLIKLIIVLSKFLNSYNICFTLNPSLN